MQLSFQALCDAAMRSKFRSGQISLEFLLIFAIFLSVLGVFLFSFSKMRNQTESALEGVLLSKIANDISYGINSVCILGDGNAREVNIGTTPEIQFSCNETALSMRSMGDVEVREADCKIACAGKIGSKIKIENRNGTVIIS